MGLFSKKNNGSKKGKLDIVKKTNIKEHLQNLVKASTTLIYKTSYDKNNSLLLKKIGENRIAFKSLSPCTEKTGSTISIVYEFSGNRFKFDTKIISYDDKTGIIISTMPKIIKDNERRREKRTIIPNRARSLVKVIPNMSGRMGFAGDIINLSKHGLSLNVDRVMDLKTEKELQFNQKIFEGIKQIQIIKFGEQGSKEIQISGKFIYLTKVGGKPRVGLEFDKSQTNGLKLVEAYLLKFK